MTILYLLKALFHALVVEFKNMHDFGNNGPSRTADIGENMNPKMFFGFHSASMGVFEKKKNT